MGAPLELTGTAWTVISAFVFLAGLCIGSFLNVCIWRIPRGESIAWPGSHCPKCGHPLGVLDNIPLLSWLCLRGKCRYCKAPITPRYFLVELLTGTLFFLLWWVRGCTWTTPIFIFYTCALLVGAFIDIEHLILPDRITLGGMVVGVALSVAWPPVQGEFERLPALWSSLIGLALGYGLLWLVAVLGKAALKREAMGMGDWKLLGAIGACLGWKAVLFTVLVSSLTGTLTGFSFILLGKKEWQSRIPYGPHLALAAVAWMLCGPELLSAYLAWALRAG